MFCFPSVSSLSLLFTYSKTLFGVLDGQFKDIYTDVIYNAKDGLIEFCLDPHESVAVKGLEK